MVKVTAKIPKGARDAMPEQMAVREHAFSVIKSVFQRHGAVGIDTPVFELKETLTGKYGEDSKLIYDLADQGGEMLSLRYDLTVPFARFVATHGIQQIKRYHIAKVYRRDNPAMNRGRFREFHQCDFDIAGYDSNPMVPDADVLKVVITVLSELEIGNFKIKLNHRKLLDAIMAVCGVPDDKLRPICSAIDKLDKETWETVKTEMTQVKGLAEEVADQLAHYVVNRAGNGPTLLAELKSDEKLSAHPKAQEAFTDLDLLFQYLEAYNVLQYVSFDLSLARGLDYYTGLIYEAVLTDSDRFGSIAAGGRYDNLVGMFSNKTVPAVGVSVGIERVLTILEEKHAANSASGKIKKSQTQVLVASIGKDMLIHRMKCAAELWAAGLATEFLYNSNPKAAPQLGKANDEQIPVIVWLGEDEIKTQTVGIKKLTMREQTKVPRAQMIEAVKAAIAEQSAPNTVNQPLSADTASEVEQKVAEVSVKGT